MFIMRILISADYEKNEKKKGNDKNDESKIKIKHL